MPLLPHAVRSDIARASFHALEGDAALVGGLAARIDAALARLDPAGARQISSEIAAAFHRIALPERRPASGPVRGLLSLRRARRIGRMERAARERYVWLPSRHPELAYICCCHEDPQVRAAALAALPEAPGPVHTALARHARESTDGGRPCTSD